jgi:hypothetical protein
MQDTLYPLAPSYAPYTLALSDGFLAGLACIAVLLFLWLAGNVIAVFFDYTPTDHLEDAGGGTHHAELDYDGAHLAAGAPLVKIGPYAGEPLLISEMWVDEYEWTGTEMRRLRRVPLCDWISPREQALNESFRRSLQHAANHPEALAAREDFFATARRLNESDHVRL